MPHAAPGNSAAARLLLVDSDPVAVEAMGRSLADWFSVPPGMAAASSGRHALEVLRNADFDVVLVELRSLQDLAEETETAVARLVKVSAGALIVILSDGSSVSAAVAAMRAGAHDFVARPLNGPAFVARLGELAQRHGKTPALALEGRQTDSAAGFAGFIGASSQMQFVYEQIERIAAAASPVFITGEAGSGKDLCAEALHEKSSRRRRRFVAVNCAAIPRDQLDGELFGVASGAFSGTSGVRKGAIELADGGTLFLEAIGEMDLSLQAKLLRFLQTGAACRVGEAATQRFDVRVICSTRRNPMQLIAERLFREDLFYRLHVLPIHLPPLRQRTADILPLARHFLARHAAEAHKVFPGFDADAANLLIGRDWPGNVRELQNLVRRLVVMFDGGDITSERLLAAERSNPGEAAKPPVLPKGEVILPMWQQEQRIIEAAIDAFAGNVTLAAAALELSPSTIYRKRQAWAELQGNRGAA